ncbi:MAG: hypothetical protein GXY84_04260 [Clostridiales bacterium]|nr:hypothetical protein [Clostridiales bacterium]
MRTIDFDSQFTAYLRAWLEAHQDEFEDIAQLELIMPQLYEQFADTPAPFLDGFTPRQFFERMDSPRQLLDLMLAYLSQQVPLPDLLLQRLAELGEAAEEHLAQLLLDPGQMLEARMICVRLLQDLGSTRLMQHYINWQLQREDRDELADFCLESLEEMGELPLPFMLEALQDANDIGREALLSVLSRYPGLPGVYEGLIRLFDALPERQAILAAYLGRLGDERALPQLIARAGEEGLRYLDYIELRAAIEALGGEAPERVFDDDPDYNTWMGIG